MILNKLFTIAWCDGDGNPHQLIPPLDGFDCCKDDPFLVFLSQNDAEAAAASQQEKWGGEDQTAKAITLEEALLVIDFSDG